ncbi:MAG: hypothetical protein ACI8ZB_002499 [Desulforhopalus sp.]|jgi:hypothetical protein
MLQKFIAIVLLLFTFALFNTEIEAQDENPEDLVRSLLMTAPADRGPALDKLGARGKQDVIASLIMVLRFRGNDPQILATLSELTGTKLNNWFEAMVWQQDHPEIKAHKSYRPLKVFLYSQLDMQFLRFLGDERALAENLDIRLEEITWGGVKVDGIPALELPKTITADKADFLQNDDLVYGAVINSEARAYPLSILGWHEMANDILGGIPVSLAYCTLCGTGLLFETMVEGREKPFTFGSSGLLYRSNKLMYDRQTDSLWNQFTGQAVSGRLKGSRIKLKTRPMVLTSWADWKKEHPETTVISLETGHKRYYSSGTVYKKYFSSPDLMFPVQVSSRGGLKPKDLVFGITQTRASKAWPVSIFQDQPLVNDQLGQQFLVLIGDYATRTVRAYQRGEEEFRFADEPQFLKTDSGLWHIEEDFLIGPKGEKLPRLPGRISYWFAWDSFIGKASELYQQP